MSTRREGDQTTLPRAAPACKRMGPQPPARGIPDPTQYCICFLFAGRYNQSIPGTPGWILQAYRRGIVRVDSQFLPNGHAQTPQAPADARRLVPVVRGGGGGGHGGGAAVRRASD
eukprot:gene4797-biopygen12170